MNLRSKRILITGASGLLGSNLFFDFKKKNYSVVGLSHQHSISILGQRLVSVNLTDPSSVLELFETESPEIVIHCAAQANVDLCEQDPVSSERINVLATQTLAETSQRAGCFFVHISTDAVYSGEQSQPVTEESPCNPINIYARQKLQAEHIVREVLRDNALILRLTLYGWNAIDRVSFGDAVLQWFSKKQTMTLFLDVVFCPILVNAIGLSIEGLLQKDATGIFNLGSTDSMTKLDFARSVLKTFGVLEQAERLIVPTPVDQKGLPARRPKTILLDVSKAQGILARQGKPLVSVQESIRCFFDLLNTGYVDELKGRAYRRELLNALEA